MFLSSADIFFFFKLFRNSISVILNTDQTGHFVGRDLFPHCLQSLSATAVEYTFRDSANVMFDLL